MTTNDFGYTLHIFDESGNVKHLEWEQLPSLPMFSIGDEITLQKHTGEDPAISTKHVIVRAERVISDAKLSLFGFPLHKRCISVWLRVRPLEE